MDDKVEEAKRVLEESVTESCTVEAIKDRYEREKSQFGDILALKAKLSPCKKMVIELETKLMLLENLEKDILNWPSIAEAETALNDACLYLSNIKKESQVVKEEVLELLDSVDNSYAQLQMKRKALQEKLVLVEEKKNHLHSLKQKWDAAKERIGELVPTDERVSLVIDKLNKKLEHAQLVIDDDASTMINDIRRDIVDTKEKCDKLTRDIQLREGNVEKLKSTLDTEPDKIEEEIKLTEQVLNFLTDLSGVRELKFGDDHLVLEFLKDSESGSAQLLVTLTFKKGFHGKHILDKVQVNIESLYIQDIVQNGLNTSEIYHLVKEIKERWHNYLCVLEDIKQIQERCPVNWIQNKNRLRVVVGNKGSVTCTLSLPSLSSKEIQLVDCKGTNKLLDEIKPSVPEPSLNDWVDFLNDYFKS